MSELDVLHTDMACLPMFVAMQANGVLINPDELHRLDAEFTGKMEALQADISRLAGRTVNPGSSEQVEKLLFKDLGLHRHSPIAKKTKASLAGEADRWSTDSDILHSILDKHPVVEPILRWKSYQKLVTTYIRVLPVLAGSDGRVRGNLRITRTTTGRPSMSKPNLLAQPHRSDDALRMRRGFVAPKGKLLLELDYSQIEMRVAAHESRDPVMCGIISSGGDLHSETASSIFRLPKDQLDKMKHRYPAKTAGFGILYMITEDGLLRQLIAGGAQGWTKESCRELIEGWYGVYQGIHPWQEGVKAQARRYGRVEDMWGRVRLIPEVLSVHRRIREEGLRNAVNAPIQMGAAGIIKRAMGAMWEFVQMVGPSCLPLLQIYDSLLLEVDRELVPWVGEELRRVMETVCTLRVPVVAKVEAGENWGEMEEV